MNFDKNKLKELEREADIAAIGAFAARNQVTKCENELEAAQANHKAAYDNFTARKNAYLIYKCGDVKLEELVRQGISITVNEPTRSIENI